jgi:hypothetical protein
LLLALEISAKEASILKWNCFFVIIFIFAFKLFKVVFFSLYNLLG